MSIRTGFKCVTHDLRPPIQGGEPLWNHGGALPAELPSVRLDTSGEECAAGYSYCADLSTALRIAGLWPNGRPSRCFHVVAGTDAIERGDKRRSSTLTILSEATETEIEAAIMKMSAPFHPFTAEMVAEQMAWRRALARPNHDPVAVVKNLQAALEVRGLSWTLKQFPDARAARGAWYPWDAWAPSGAWDAWYTRDAKAAWGAWCAWGPRGAWYARDARDALTVSFAARQRWTKDDPALLTTGLRDAYENGLAIAVPVGPNELGYALEPSK